MTDMALRRFHAALVDAMESRGLDLSRPFTVAEIYQDLVPYRTHRDVLGVEINGDYEHLLLRLLAGEEDLVRLESNAALERISEELEESNPNTGIFREFAAVDVKLVSAAEAGSRPAVQLHTDERVDVVEAMDEEPIEIEAFAPASTPAPRPQLQVQLDDGRSEPGPATTPRVRASEPDPEPQEEAAVDAPEVDSFEATGAAGEEESTGAEPCRWCRQQLPERANLNFCPFCGESTSIAPCGSCGEPIEPEWRFCIACGTEVPTS